MNEQAIGRSETGTSFEGTARSARDVRRTRRRNVAVALLLIGVAAAVTSPLVGGDRFLADGRPATIQIVGNGSRLSTSTFESTLQEYMRSGVLPRGWSVTSKGSIGLVRLGRWNRAWILATAALFAIPSWFWWWRRAAMTHARTIGLAASVAAGVCLTVLVWPASQMCAAVAFAAVPAFYLAAFLVAPTPQARED